MNNEGKMQKDDLIVESVGTVPMKFTLCERDDEGEFAMMFDFGDGERIFYLSKADSGNIARYINE